ncbi:MAG: transcriptional regulator [Clostridiales bacterium]|nr:transcriptional regulator [Clostridiales bacterium]
MKETKPELKVYMLGSFSIVYGDETISFKRNSTTKAMKLLQILLHASACGGGISRTRLWEDLFGREELANVANNLRVTVFRLRKMLTDAGLPEHDYIQIDNGIYKWDSPMEVYIDTADFTNKVKAAETEEDTAKKMQLLQEACELYRGEFLPALSGEDWVIINSVQYKKLYTNALLQVCEWLKSQREYETILALTKKAVEIYPFDEWQVLQIDALVALNRYKEAYQYYEETSKMFFEELGISPSEKMIEQFKNMSRKMGRDYQDAGEIMNGLKETEYEQGAFYCTLPSFRDGYRLVRRILERNGQSAYLMVCSLTDGQGRPLEGKEKLQVLSENLHPAIKRCLRRGDSFTKYSPSQFLILLIGTNRENCDMIFHRIRDAFTANHKGWKQNLEYYVSTVLDVETKEDSRISFRKNKFFWK